MQLYSNNGVMCITATVPLPNISATMWYSLILTGVCMSIVVLSTCTVVLVLQPLQIQCTGFFYLYFSLYMYKSMLLMIFCFLVHSFFSPLSLSLSPFLPPSQRFSSLISRRGRLAGRRIVVERRPERIGRTLLSRAPVVPASEIPEELIEEALSVLQGKSREVVVRELQRTVS